MKKMNQLRKFGAKASVAFGILGLMATQAYAAVPADATTALTDAKADATTIGTAVFVILVAIAAFKYMRRSL